MATTSKRTAKPTSTSTKAATQSTPAKKAVKKRVNQPALKTANTTVSKTANKKASKTASKIANTTPSTTAAGGEVTLRGRSVFVVQTTKAGVVVRSAWMSEDKTLKEMPAVFPNAEYAVNVLDDLKRQVLQHFERATRVGTQVIANQRDKARN